MWFALGITLLVAAFVALCFELRTSYVTHGGENGQVPVLGGAIQVPLLVLVGLWFLGRAKPAFDSPWWSYPVVGMTLAVITGWLIIKVGNLGKHRHACGN
jgi:hypothetical protein